MRGKKTAKDILEAIDELSRAKGLSPKQIEKLMRQNVKLLDGRPAPSLTTIKRQLRPVGPKRETLPAWSITEADAAEIDLVQPVLRAVLVGTEGRISNFTAAEAAWVARVRHGASGLRPWFAWRIAAAYLLAEERGRPADKAALDTLMIFRPWDSREAMSAFEDWTLAHRPEWWGLERGPAPALPLIHGKPAISGLVIRAPAGGLRPMNVAAILATEIEVDLGWAWGGQPPPAPAKTEAD